MRLLQTLHEHNCRRFVFSSSATVYGTSVAPVTEDSPVGLGISNPYGRSKFIVEEVLRDFSESEMGKEWAIMILRYFNPVGAHESGLIGEDPSGIPNNLMPYVLQVAIGRRKELTVFGNDYPTVGGTPPCTPLCHQTRTPCSTTQLKHSTTSPSTQPATSSASLDLPHSQLSHIIPLPSIYQPDGTGVRDYIHVMDLADGHQKSLLYMDQKGVGLYTFNLGSG